MPVAAKIDLFKELKHEYGARRSPSIVEVGPAQFLAIEGRGEPGGSVFSERVQSLYRTAYGIKKNGKKAGQDFAVCKLEGLWWGSRSKTDFFHEPRNQWNWKLLIRMPDFITTGERTAAIAALQEKEDEPLLAEVKLDSFHEGRCVQMLHVGPYQTETETIETMHAFATDAKLSFHGLHHEIYLGDPKRVAPEKLKTIIRLPVR